MAKKINYIAPVQYSSGYGSAARNYIYGLIKYSDYNVSVSPLYKNINYNVDLSKFGEIGKTIEKHIKKPVDYDINIFQTTLHWYIKGKPYDKFRGINIDGDKINIGMFAWETDKLSHKWSKYLNDLDYLITFSLWQKKVLSQSLNIPVYYLPHIVIKESYSKEPFKFEKKFF